MLNYKLNTKKIMKKIFFILTATALLSVSCQKNENPSTADGNANVSICVNLPEVPTKAIADGKTATVLKYELYYKDEADAYQKIETEKTTLTDLKAQLDFTLMRNTSYAVLFWAQAETAPYNSDDLQAVLMNYTANTGNLETRDAFCGKLEFTVSDDDLANTGLQTTLERPFAQVNFAANDYSTPLSFNGNVVGNMVLKGTEVTLKKLATKYNVMTGKASATGTDETIDVTFVATGGVDADNDTVIDEFETGYKYISMNYILVPDGATNVAITAKYSVDITYIDSGITVTNFPIPGYDGTVNVATNYRTNIKGELFTESGVIETVVDPAFLGDNDNLVD